MKTRILCILILLLSIFINCSNTFDNGNYGDYDTGGSANNGGQSGIGGLYDNTPPITLPSFGGTSGNDNTGGSVVCASIDVEFEQTLPTVALMIDRSGSMLFDDFISTRWDAVGDALFNDNNGVVNQLQNSVYFGLAMYNSNGGDAGGECPIVVTTDPSLGSANSMQTLFDVSAPQNIEDTPTGDSIDWVVDNFAFSIDGPNIIILATDGEPDTCEIPNPNNPTGNPDGRLESEAAVARAYDNGIEIFVISVGTAVGFDHLQDIANLGNGKNKNTTENEPVYIATSAADLTLAFNEIINGVRSCSFELEGEIQEGYEDKGIVSIDGVELTLNDPNGYIVLDSSTIEFVGSSCELIKSGDREIEIEFPCETFEPIPR